MMPLNWKFLALCSFAIAFAALPLQAQKASGGGRSGGGTVGTPTMGNSSVFGSQPMQPTVLQPEVPEVQIPKAQVVEDESCLPWALSQIRGATVSVMRLEVPDKARSEYDKACGDFRKKKLADAEQHIRSAIEKYSNYVAAWVMLGQVLAAQQQADQAHEACSRANSADPTYLPPYLCLAELDANSGQWDEILNVTKTALGLNPVGDVYAYFYRSMAYFNLHRLGEAERSALQAEGSDVGRHQASVHYLLAQIYEAKGDLGAATAELRQFLKINQDKQKGDEARQYLAKLQSQEPAK